MNKFDAIITSIEKLLDLDTITLKELVGTLKVRKDKLKDFPIMREEKALFAKVFVKYEKKNFENPHSNGSEHGSGRDRGGRRGNHKANEDEDEEKQRYKSKGTYYNCQGKGHYPNEWGKPKKERIQNDNPKKAHLALEEKETILLMPFNEWGEILLQSIAQCDLSRGVERLNSLNF